MECGVINCVVRVSRFGTSGLWLDHRRLESAIRMAVRIMWASELFRSSLIWSRRIEIYRYSVQA